MANRWAKEELQDTNKTVITKLQDTNKTAITGNREQGTGNREAESDTENKTPSPYTPKGGGGTDGFSTWKPPKRKKAKDSDMERFYSAYPRKIAVEKVQKGLGESQARIATD